MQNCDLHVHLYGCLSAKDVWTLGKEIWQKRFTRLIWYEREYQKAWSRLPLWQKYWTSKNGLALLKEDYLFTRKANFQQFQACFNLIIALFPIDPNDVSIISYLFKKLVSLNCSYLEVRCPLSPFFTNKDTKTYLTNLAKYARQTNKEHSIKINLIVSLSRQNAESLKQYNLLRAWCCENIDLSKYFVGLDFSGYEEDDEPSSKKDLIAKILFDNQRLNKKLGLTCHVGESFTTISLLTSLRRIEELSSYKVNRLSNTISLGINTNYLQGKRVEETTISRTKTLKWVKEILKIDNQEISKKINHLNKKNTQTTIVYDKDEIYLTNIAQEIVCKRLKKRGTIVEVCPTSNMRIGMIASNSNHPLLALIKRDLKLCICSDDPGIFDTCLNKEITYCKDNLGISSSVIDKISSAASQYSFS